MLVSRCRPRQATTAQYSRSRHQVPPVPLASTALVAPLRTAASAPHLPASCAPWERPTALAHPVPWAGTVVVVIVPRAPSASRACTAGRSASLPQTAAVAVPRGRTAVPLVRLPRHAAVTVPQGFNAPRARRQPRRWCVPSGSTRLLAPRPARRVRWVCTVRQPGYRR